MPGSKRCSTINCTALSWNEPFRAIGKGRIRLIPRQSASGILIPRERPTRPNQDPNLLQFQHNFPTGLSHPWNCVQCTEWACNARNRTPNHAGPDSFNEPARFSRSEMSKHSQKKNRRSCTHSLSKPKLAGVGCSEWFNMARNRWQDFKPHGPCRP